MSTIIQFIKNLFKAKVYKSYKKGDTVYYSYGGKGFYIYLVAEDSSENLKFVFLTRSGLSNSFIRVTKNKIYPSTSLIETEK